MATYIGWLMHRTLGGVIAGVLYGIKPAVTAIVLFAAYRIGARALKNAQLRAIAALAFLAIFLLHMPIPLIVLSAALLGAIGGKRAPHYFYFSAEFSVYSGRRSADRIDARQSQIYRPVDRHHRGGGRRDPEPCRVLRLSCVLAERFLRTFRLCLGADRRGGWFLTLPLPGRSDGFGAAA